MQQIVETFCYPFHSIQVMRHLLCFFVPFLTLKFIAALCSPLLRHPMDGWRFSV